MDDKLLGCDDFECLKGADAGLISDEESDEDQTVQIFFTKMAGAADKDCNVLPEGAG